MIRPLGAGQGTTVPPRDEERQLRNAAQQLEGMFVQQLYKAMRETVPQDEGFVSGGAGEEIFTSLMDQQLAAETPEHWESGIAEALYRQLRGHAIPRLADTPDVPTPSLPTTPDRSAP